MPAWDTWHLARVRPTSPDVASCDLMLALCMRASLDASIASWHCGALKAFRISHFLWRPLYARICSQTYGRVVYKQSVSCRSYGKMQCFISVHIKVSICIRNKGCAHLCETMLACSTKTAAWCDGIPPTGRTMRSDASIKSHVIAWPSI